MNLLLTHQERLSMTCHNRKKFFKHTIPHCKVIAFKATMGLNNDKAAITICKLNAHLSQLEVGCKILISEAAT